MNKRILLAAAVSAGICSAAFAQTTPDTAAGAMGPGLPTTWEGPIADAFFDDVDAGTLRTDDELRSNWQNLTDEQQAQVRAHCLTVDTAAAAPADTDTTAATTPSAGTDAGTTAATTPGTSADTDTTASTTTPGAAGASGTAAADMEFGANVDMATLTRLCDMVEGM
jgi:predicted Fe-S protein YdhL (DUF1289 family)